MFGKKLLFFIFLFSTVAYGCAKPTYIKKTEQVSANSSNENFEEKTNCNIQFNKSKICLIWDWELLPTNKEKGSLVFKTFRLNLLDQTPVEVDLEHDVNVLLWMPGMGHGSSPTSTEKIDTGTYKVSDVFFIMPGDWEIKFQTKKQDLVIDEAVIDFNF